MGILILILLCLAACSRDFENPHLPSSPQYVDSAWSADHDGDGVSDSVEKYAPGCRGGPDECLSQAQAQAIAEHPPGDTSKPGIEILVESIFAPDMRLTVGETKPAKVELLPLNVSSRNYELSSQNGEVAVVRPGGIFAAGPGTTRVIMHALDGSDKVGEFKVTVVTAKNKD